MAEEAGRKRKASRLGPMSGLTADEGATASINEIRNIVTFSRCEAVNTALAARLQKARRAARKTMQAEWSRHLSLEGRG